AARARQVLFRGPEFHQSCMHESAKDTMHMSKEQPSSSAGSASDSVPIRLHTVRVWFPLSGLRIKEEIKRAGLKDEIFDAIVLQDFSVQHQTQNFGIIKNAFLVDLAVLETGI
ncbi:uncharacterized protein N7479_001726, partial [Penicillium vulpinum]|uniref:uncharacterized protein n=1 Tax=Penicillium vulpinum TaxID=29845 RepID=UPI002546D017